MYLDTHRLCVSISNMDLLGRHMELQPSFQVSPLFLSQPSNLYGAEQCHVFPLTLCFGMRAICLAKRISTFFVQYASCLKFSCMWAHL